MKQTIRKILRYFDKLEDRVRAKLSHFTIVYAFLGGVAIVIFWRGVWNTCDILASKGGIWGFVFYEPFTIFWSTVLLLISGLFVSFFVGDRIILSGLKKEKKIEEKTEEELRREGNELRNLSEKIEILVKDIAEIKKHTCITEDKKPDTTKVSENITK
jgi:hypothetical protein